jgi:phosphoglycolate phosphatase-like HAD superfamily hydrolase
VASGVIRAVILDFDGVVIESNDAKTEAFRDVFAAFPEHLDAMMDFHARNISTTRFVKFDHLLDRLGRPNDTALRDTLAAEFSRCSRDRIAVVPLVAGAESFLMEFSPLVPLYLASVTPQEDLDATLDRRHLGRWFRVAYGCPPWTKPTAINDILGHEGCAPSDIVLIGDSLGDQRAAAETGIEFVGRDSGIGLNQGEARIFPDMFAVADYLRSRIS